MLHWTWCICFLWLVQFQFPKTNYFTLPSTTMTHNFEFRVGKEDGYNVGARGG